MVATNHALTGAVIGLSLHHPLLAIPLAFLSHFALDSLPHFGSKRLPEGGKAFIYYLALDASLCGALVLTLFLGHVPYWWLAAICAFMAASPDFMWFRDFLALQQKRRLPKRTILKRFHAWVQWYEKEPGIIIEFGWAAGMLVLLAKLSTI